MVDRQSECNIKIKHLKKGAHCIQIKNLITESNFDIFTKSEAWLNELVDDSEIAIPEYVMCVCERIL